MESYKYYKNLKRNRETAERWIALKDVRDSQDDKPFLLSLIHSKVMLMRCGQFSAGSQNYHESPKELNEAILFAIKKHYDIVILTALNYMRYQEDKALVKCESDVNSVQETIKKAKLDITEKGE